MEEVLLEPCSLLIVSMLVCWCLDMASCNYSSSLLLVHGKAETAVSNDRDMIKRENSSISGSVDCHPHVRAVKRPVSNNHWGRGRPFSPCESCIYSKCCGREGGGDGGRDGEGREAVNTPSCWTSSQGPHGHHISRLHC